MLSRHLAQAFPRPEAPGMGGANAPCHVGQGGAGEEAWPPARTGTLETDRELCKGGAGFGPLIPEQRSHPC